MCVGVGVFGEEGCVVVVGDPLRGAEDYFLHGGGCVEGYHCGLGGVGDYGFYLGEGEGSFGKSGVSMQERNEERV